MSRLYHVTKECLRYIVPFRYHGSFTDMCDRVDQQQEPVQQRDKKTGEKIPTGEYRHLWIRRVESENGPESDLYTYVRNEFRFNHETDRLAEEKSGCSWLFWRSEEAVTKDGGTIYQLNCFPEGIQVKGSVRPEFWNVSITNAGLFLFRNGLGFFWYEIRIKKKDMSSYELIWFQNNAKELGKRRQQCFLWERSMQQSEDGIQIEGMKGYFSPFLIGSWVNRMLAFGDISYLAERGSADNSGNPMPDKALLFTYVAFDSENAERQPYDQEELSYYLTNGYKDSYHFSPEISKEMKHPFENAIWYAAQNGVSYLAWPAVDNKEFFMSNLLSKICVDYFTLYIKAVYQSFSLMHYAERTQTELPALEGGAHVQVTELFGEINLFLAKSIATSVSYIHHQSEFYVYLNRQLRIQEDVQSVTIGLNALESLQRDRDQAAERKSEGKTQAIMGLFAMLGISSALTDCYDFVGKFFGGDQWSELSIVGQLVELGCISVIVMISVVAVIFAVKAVKDAFKPDSLK